MDRMSEPPTRQEMTDLRNHLDARLGGLEDWLKRVTEALERLSEGRERTLVLEQRVNTCEQNINDLKASDLTLSSLAQNTRGNVIKLMSIGSVLAAFFTIIIPVVVTLIMNKVIG